MAEIDAYARAKDPRVRQVSCSLAGEWQVVEIMRPGGEIYRDVRPLVRLNISVVVEEDGRQETGFYGGGGRARLHRLHRARLLARRRGRGAAKALVNLASVPAPAGEMTVVLGAGWPGHPAARGGRPWARGRLQPQENLRLCRACWASGSPRRA